MMISLYWHVTGLFEYAQAVSQAEGDHMQRTDLSRSCLVKIGADDVLSCEDA
jgi:hypothetical protein